LHSRIFPRGVDAGADLCETICLSDVRFRRRFLFTAPCGVVASANCDLGKLYHSLVVLLCGRSVAAAVYIPQTTTGFMCRRVYWRHVLWQLAHLISLTVAWRWKDLRRMKSRRSCKSNEAVGLWRFAFGKQPGLSATGTHVPYEDHTV